MTKNGSPEITRRFAARLLIALIAFSLLALPNLTQVSAQDASSEDASVHVVQAGETLSEIAKQYGVPMQTLMNINGIVDPDSIVVGRRLRLPEERVEPVEEGVGEIAETGEITKTEEITGAGEITETDAIVADETAVDQGAADEGAVDESAEKSVLDADRSASLNSRYTVQSGDILGLIALRAGVDVDELNALNNLPTEGPIGLVAGQTLILPATNKQLNVNQQDTTYTVQPGDVLGTIANDHGLTMAELMKANYISDPNLVTVGQELIIPSPEEEEVESGVLVGPRRRGFYYYTVQPGDTLSEIARDFDSTILALLEFNNLPDEGTVYTGLDLRIPFGPPKIPQRLTPVPLSATSFLVSLSRQECWLFEGGQVKERWICSTGYGKWITRTGTFNVKTKMEMAQSSAYRLDMPYWLGLYDVGDFENGIHGLPIEWDTGEKLWDGLIGQPATFGCAMLDDNDAPVLFEAAYLGMPVHVMQ